ncbi:NTE family protein [Crenobacter luteus]|uniref:PNPLA domain-containing protein n=1 Tax=Crenobacter luteus TaxID=1452487 RepID=A0A163DQ96_9NEIS|nr:patatin-like phospholipase family protein [Crenobacter luteus]KZE35136.1 hypothetical protein AVW16_05020 [Crenobacter luteus]TCP12440.1 NTE family protein [Crenobacter luteus]
MKRWLVAGGLALSLSLAHAAPSPEVTPRIGVVLGGGGARGFAHLGVLRELERLRIPVACIAGTSAGSLIGGMYASGVSLDEMARAFRAADWEQMLSGSPRRASVPYDRKRDDYKNYFNLTLGLRDGAIRVPRSAINSQEIDLFIRRLVRDRSAPDFDTLPIPFRAVATDLETGDAVVFDKGDLATAMRSSMAVPGVFDLVETGGRLLVDGGLARNLPIREVKGRCADRVIVVDVSSPTLKKDEINSLFDIVAQTTNLMVSRNMREELARLEPGDIVIRPELDGYSAADFAKNAEIAERGRLAVAPLAAQLAELSVPEAAWRAWQARLTPVEPKPIDAVRVAPTRFVNAAVIERQLNDEAGRPQALETLQGKLETVFAGGDFDRLGYQLGEEDGRRVLTVTPTERTVGPNYLRFGLDLKSSTPGDADFTFLAAHERVWVNRAGGVWRNDVQLGDDKLFRTSFRQPLEAGSPWFGYASYQLRKERFPVFLGGHVRLADLQIDTNRLEFGGGAGLGEFGEFRVGAYQQRLSAGVRVGDPATFEALTAEPTRSLGLSASLVADQFDNPRWPRRGYYVSGAYDYEIDRDSRRRTQLLNGMADGVYTLGDNSFRLTAKYKDNLGGELVSSVPPTLGGFLNLSGYQQDELLGERAALARLMLYRRVATLPSALGSGLYVGASLEAGKVWGWFGGPVEGGDTRWITGGSLFVGADTLLGPFFVGVGNAKGGQLTSYLFLGVDY